MSPQVLGLVVGGLVPALGYALFAIWTKYGSQAGIGPGPFMVFVGLACVAVGAVFCWILPANWNTKSATYALLSGAVWAVGSGCVSFALTRWGIPISKLTPLYNTNTLITVLLGLVLFAEWKQASAWQLSLGAVFILVGSVLVSRA